MFKEVPFHLITLTNYSKVINLKKYLKYVIFLGQTWLKSAFNIYKAFYNSGIFQNHPIY